MMKQNIVLYGAGGLSHETLWLINSTVKLKKQYKVIAFGVDDNYFTRGQSLYNLPVVNRETMCKLAENEPLGVVVAIGNAKVRRRIFEELSEYRNFCFPSIITCDISSDVEIGEGAVIHKNCMMSTNTKIGKCLLMHTSSTLGHDVVIGDFVSIMPRCDISGNVNVGDNVSIGAHSFILEKKSIGENSVIAPGSIVMRNVPPNVTVMGNPAKICLRH